MFQVVVVGGIIVDGMDDVDGVDGMDDVDGVDGMDGVDGVAITWLYFSLFSHVVIRLCGQARSHSCWNKSNLWPKPVKLFKAANKEINRKLSFKCSYK